MLFVTTPEGGERLWIPLDKVCLVEEDANEHQLRIYVLEQDEPVTLENPQEMALFLQAFARAHNNDVVSDPGQPA